jgi:hypothetical protein
LKTRTLQTKVKHITNQLNSSFSAAEAKRLADEKLKKEAADKGTYIIYHLNYLFSAALEQKKLAEEKLKKEGISFNCLLLIIFIEQKKLADEKLKKEAAEKGKTHHQSVKLSIFSCSRTKEAH